MALYVRLYFSRFLFPLLTRYEHGNEREKRRDRHFGGRSAECFKAA